MENATNLPATLSTECTLSALQSNPKTQHLIPARTTGYFQVSNIQLNDELMFSIWEFMSGIYGHKWTDQFGNLYDENGNVQAVVNTWAQALSRITPVRLHRGMTKCIHERQSPFPPTLPEFVQLCAKEPWE